MKISLSYLVTTRNRIAFLKITLEKLIDELREDEEIVVVDGNSTDGSKEYLQNLFEQKKIHQFISEPDHNQAHGWNKAMLMANGTILKKIIDDDVHDYTAIRKCRDFMLLHPGIDVCISDCLISDLSNPDKVSIASRLPWFKRWKAGGINVFTFNDVHLLMRRSAISYIGLYDTQFKMMDWEYSLRISFLKAGIAYYTGYNSMSVATPGNVTSSLTKAQAKYEEAIGKAKYGYPGDRSEISLWSEIKITLGIFIARFKSKTIATFKTGTSAPGGDELAELYRRFYETLKEYNSGDSHEFIY